MHDITFGGITNYNIPVSSWEIMVQRRKQLYAWRIYSLATTTLSILTSRQTVRTTVNNFLGYSMVRNQVIMAPKYEHP
jgi:hypothetical protein